MKKKKILLKFNKGGQNKPLIVNNPNDQRLKLYEDSLARYNYTQNLLNKNDGLQRLQSVKNFDTEMSNANFNTDRNYTPQNFIQISNDNFQTYKIIPNFPKPVQPIIYEPEGKKEAVILGNRSKPTYRDSLEAYNTALDVYRNIGKYFDEEYKYTGKNSRYAPFMEGLARGEKPLLKGNDRFFGVIKQPLKDFNLQEDIKFWDDVAKFNPEQKRYVELAKQMHRLENLKVKPYAASHASELPTAYLYKKPTGEQPINIQSAKPDLLQGTNNLEFNPIPYKPNSYFTREQQGQEVGGKEYFDKTTGKKLENGGTIDMKKKFKKLKNGGDTTLTKEQAKYAANQLRGWYNEDRLPSKFVKGRTEYDNPIYQDLQEGDKRWIKGLMNDPMQLSPFQFFQQQLAPGSGNYPINPYNPRNTLGQPSEFSYGGKLKKAETGFQMPDFNQSQNNQAIWNPLQQQGVNLQPITQAPNFKQQIETPQINAYDFYNPQTGNLNQKQPNLQMQQFGQDALSQLQNKDIPVPSLMPRFTGSKHWTDAQRKMDKGMELAVKAGKSVVSAFTGGMGGGASGGGSGMQIPNMSMRNGGKFMLPKASMGWSAIADAASYGTGAVASFAGAGVDQTQALLDTIGNNNINNQTKKWENDLMRQSLMSQEMNPVPMEQYGYNFGGRNNALQMAQGGSINDYKSYNTGGMANVEVEDKETIQTNNGLIDSVYGATHAEGGIPMMLQEGSKVFSEKLKHPDTKKSFAKIAKKFETKKDIDNIDSKFADSINKETSKFNISLKNKLSDELFQEQEVLKLNGVFGNKVKQEAIDNYTGNMANGGKLPKAEFGVDNNPSLRGTKKGVVEDYPSLEAAYLDYKSKGYKGTKDETEMRRWDYQRNPQETLAYIRRSQPTNKHLKIWKEKYDPKGTEKYPRLEMMTDEDVFSGYDDQLWDFRLNKPSKKELKQLNFKGKEERPSDTVDPKKIDKLKSLGFDFSRIRPTGINLAIPDVYAKDPIWTKNLSPEYINPRYYDPSQELNQLGRDYNTIASNIDYSGSGIANLLQAQTNKRYGNESIFAKKRQYDQAQDNNAQQFNAQSKMNTDQFNVGQFNRFIDQILRREGALDTQRRTDSQGRVQNSYNQEAYEIGKDEISRMFNPSMNSQMPIFNYANLTPDEVDQVRRSYDEYGRLKSTTTTDKKKNGGKLSIKMKLKKKK